MLPSFRRLQLLKSAVSLSQQSESIRSLVPESHHLKDLRRYLPGDAKALLVEEIRLDPSEKVSQRVSSTAPWLLFLFCAGSPFLLMKYNLERLNSKPQTPSQVCQSPRYPLKKIQYSSVPEILERRNPTFIFCVANDFHSQLLGMFAKELDRILGANGMLTSVCFLDYDSTDDKFKSKFPLPAFGHLISPGYEVRDFPGPWRLKEVLSFLVPTGSITDSMVSDVTESESKLMRFRECLFKRRFAQIDKSWTFEGIMDQPSLDSAIDKCENRLYPFM